MRVPAGQQECAWCRVAATTWDWASQPRCYGGFLRQSGVNKRRERSVAVPPARRKPGTSTAKPGRSSHMRSLGQRAYDLLLGILLAGELRPNDVVMERRLAEKLGISRTPLREAIRRLEGEKLLERQKGGTIVVSPMSVERFLNILSVRRLLEGEAVRRAAGLISSEDLLRFRERVTDARDAADPKELAELGRELHLYIAHSSGNPVLASVIEDMRKRTRLFIRSFMRVSELREQVCEEHLALIAALLQKDGEAAKAAREQHIDNIRAYILGKLATL